MHGPTLNAILSLDATDTPEVQVFRLDTGGFNPAGGVRVDDNGQPHKSYTKQIMRAGAKVYNTGGKLVVLTAELADRIAASFAAMTTAKIRVPVQMGHDIDGEKTLGVVKSLWRDGLMLCAEVEMIGQRAIEAASKLDVSVYIEPAHKRDGTVYLDALTHLACTPMPQVTGLGPFTPIAASLEDRVFSTDPAKEDPTMWKTLAAILSLDVSKLTDETGPAAVEAAMRTTVTERAALAASMTAKTKEVETLQLSVGTLTAQVSAGAPAVDSDILDEHAEITTGKIAALADKRIINPAQKDKLTALLCGASGSRNALCLSTKHAKHAGLPASIANSVLEILSLGVATGGTPGRAQTGAQGKGSDSDAPAAPGEDFHKLVSSYMPSGR